MADYLVGCDVGTGGTKAVVIGTDGTVLGSHYVEYPLMTPRPGWAEHDPEWYWNAVADTIQVSIKESRVDPKDIKGVSISALSPACILVDKQLRPLQNSHIWMDRRATAETQWIRENIGDDRVFQLSGNPNDPYYATVKLLWEKNNRPELYKEAYKLQTAADYPVMKLTGKAITDYSNACLIGIAFDIVNRKWDMGLIEELGLDPALFPDAYPCDQVIGEVTREAAERTGLAPGTPVVAGTVDCNAAWVAGGATDSGETSLVMGTAGVLGIVHEEPKFTKDMISIIHTADSENKYTTLAALVSCGALLRYFRDTFGSDEIEAGRRLGLSPYELMSMSAKKVDPGSDGLIMLPYFMGERTPIWDPLARGVLFGWSLSHTRGHVIRAMMEAVAYGLRHNFELMKESGIFIKYPIVMGEGGAQSEVWRQIVCDVLKVEGVYMEGNKGAPFGNAINAGVGVGIFKSYDVGKQWVSWTDRHEPNPANAALYDGYYKIFRQLYPVLTDSFKDLADVSGYV